jgi:hypothetical protein
MLYLQIRFLGFVDCIKSNSKSRVKFWGAIADSYNSTTDEHRQRTVKNLKDHWVSYNKQVSLFNQIYTQESSSKQTGADDAMVLETAKQRYKNQTVAEFKRLHWWQTVRHQSKWMARSSTSSKMDRFLSWSEATIEEEVTCPIGQDRPKADVADWEREG